MVRVVPANDRQPSDIILDHLCDRLTQQFVRVSENQIAAACFQHGHRPVAIEAYGPKYIAARYDAYQLAILIDYWRTLTTCQLWVAPSYAIRQLRHCHSGHNRRDVPIHNFLDSDCLQGVHRVLSHNVMAVTGDLFGQD